MKLSHFVVLGLIILGFHFFSKGSTKVIDVDSVGAFDREVARSTSKPVLAYFWAPW